MADHHSSAREHFRLVILISIHAIICCLSLIRLADSNHPITFDPPTFHIFFDLSGWYVAAAVVAAFLLVGSLFAFSDFSFGYFVGFYFYTMILSYLWLNCFTDLKYDHRLAGFSAATSAVAFLLPALFIGSTVRQVYVLSETAFDRLLTFILLLGVVTIAVGASYNFRLVAVQNIYEFRNRLESPTILNYLIGITSSALLPFAFAGFVVRKAYWRASTVLLMLLVLYPVTLTKLALFTPCWLVFILFLSKLIEARTAVVMSLLLPLLAILILVAVFKSQVSLLFFVNFRMIAIPSVAMDVYNDFFSRHDLTFFCQISLLKHFVSCPYQNELSIVMQQAYKLGNFNASLFATEGIASVGVFFAPITIFICGLVIGLGNRLSAGLPAGFILTSGAILPQVFLNVPLTTVLLTHGGALLFLLWYVTPRTISE